MSGSFAQTGSHSVGITMIPFVFLFNAGYAVAVLRTLLSSGHSSYAVAVSL
ncbi:hypothetical protein RAB80_010126 [Fusarium oxysporum f. sp. vasinfectum]|nr:hypothetical protein RAB80_010126 [Fusarium oxysporum f. sp. vasinfectum]KAK2931571.1 hypothetical protein FoTM2_009083 [Fusarium oxysporum f. sp. vasinfectum]